MHGPLSFRNKVIDLMSHIKLITGAIMYPDGSPEQRLHVDVIAEFLKVSPRFSQLTYDEIVHAFYLNSAGEFGTLYKHWHREFTTDYLGEVLNAYLSYKDKQLADKLKLLNETIEPPPALPQVQLREDDWKRFVNEDIACCRYYGHTDFIFNIGPKYALLRKLGYLKCYSAKHWWYCYGWAIRKRLHEILRKVVSTTGGKVTKKLEIQRLQKILDTGILQPGEHREFVENMRKYLYTDVIRAVSLTSVTDLFNEVLP